MIDFEKLLREGKSNAEIQKEINKEIAAVQDKLNAEKKAAEKAKVKEKQLESARKAFKEASINYMDALGLLEDYDEKDLQEIDKVFNVVIETTEKAIKTNKLPAGGTEIKAKFNGFEDLFSDIDIIKNFVKELL